MRNSRALLIVLAVFAFVIALAGCRSKADQQKSDSLKSAGCREALAPPGKFQTRVMLNDNATSEQIAVIKSYLQHVPKVTVVRYVSKQDALAEAKAKYENNPGVIDNLPANPFPQEFHVSSSSSSAGEVIARHLQHQPGVQPENGVNSGDEQRSSDGLEQAVEDGVSHGITRPNARWYLKTARLPYQKSLLACFPK